MDKSKLCIVYTADVTFVVSCHFWLTVKVTMCSL